MKEQIDQTYRDIERAERENNLEEAARLRYGVLHELQNKVKEAEKRLAEIQQEGALLKEEVDAEEIAEIVSRWTGIPVSRLLEGEMKKLLEMESVCINA